MILRYTKGTWTPLYLLKDLYTNQLGILKIVSDPLAQLNDIIGEILQDTSYKLLASMSLKRSSYEDDN